MAWFEILCLCTNYWTKGTSSEKYNDNLHEYWRSYTGDFFSANASWSPENSEEMKRSVRNFLGCCLYTALVKCRRRLTENAFQKWYWKYEPSIKRTGAFNEKWINLQNVCGMLSQNVVEAGMRHEHTVADTYSPQNLVTFILRAYYIIWLVSAGLAHPVIFKVRIIFDSRRQPVVETSNVGTRTHF